MIVTEGFENPCYYDDGTTNILYSEGYLPNTPINKCQLPKPERYSLKELSSPYAQSRGIIDSTIQGAKTGGLHDFLHSLFMKQFLSLNYDHKLATKYAGLAAEGAITAGVAYYSASGAAIYIAVNRLPDILSYISPEHASKMQTIIQGVSTVVQNLGQPICNVAASVTSNIIANRIGQKAGAWTGTIIASSNGDRGALNV